MFYLKTKKGTKLYIEDDNVYTTCSICGKEFAVNLAEIIRDGDLYSTAAVCPDCAADGR